MRAIAALLFGSLAASPALLHADTAPVFIAQIGGPGSALHSAPHGIAVGHDGTVYVPDYDNNRVLLFDAGGTPLGQWGGVSGTGDGQFSGPIDVAVNAAGDIYVLELVNRRVQKFTSDGTFLLKFGSAGLGLGQFQEPHGIACSPNGNVYVVDDDAGGEIVVWNKVQ
jgi:DNA-binding beta-propeller fold protein YncE